MSEHDLHRYIKANFAILIVSDTRDEKTDESGRIAKKLVSDQGHQVLAYQILRNDKSLIQQRVREMIQNPEINVIITSGGTGISKRDVTVEAASPLFAKKTEGFGQIFRQLSYQEIGEAAQSASEASHLSG